MGVFLGIILGCAVAFVHNRVVGIEFRGALSIYGNSKLVLIVMLPLVGMFAIATVYLWPVVELGISALTGFMKSFGAIGVFLYGFLNRFLIPHRAASSDLVAVRFYLYRRSAADRWSDRHWR